MLGGNVHVDGREQGRLAELQDDNESQFVEEDVVVKLFRVWRNERASPELLPAPLALITDIVELLRHQSDTISSHKSTRVAQSTVHAITDCLQQMDLERVKFALKSLLRARLGKIERNWASFQEVWNPEHAAALRALLSPAEKEYLDSFASNLLSCLNESVLSKVPSELASLQDPEMLADGAAPIACAPQLSAHVICRVRRSIGEIVLDPVTRATASLDQNDVFVLQYQVIRDYIAAGDVELI